MWPRRFILSTWSNLFRVCIHISSDWTQSHSRTSASVKLQIQYETWKARQPLLLQRPCVWLCVLFSARGSNTHWNRCLIDLLRPERMSCYLCLIKKWLCATFPACLFPGFSSHVPVCLSTFSLQQQQKSLSLFVRDIVVVWRPGTKTVCMFNACVGTACCIPSVILLPSSDGAEWKL